MGLNQQQIQVFADWIENRIPNYSCPCCNAKNFMLGGIISASHVAADALIVTPSVPMIQLVCPNCAHTTLFSTEHIGL